MAYRACVIDGCDADADTHKGGARGWCKTHYARWRRHGDPLHGGDVLRQTTTGQPCSIDDCSKPTVGRGYCENHYRRWKRYGNPLAGRVPVGLDPADRFWAKVNKTETCWLWLDRPNSAGYGTFKVNGATMMAHRYAWVLAGETLTPGMTLDHLCRNTLCVRREHLEEVTYAENLARRPT